MCTRTISRRRHAVSHMMSKSSGWSSVSISSLCITCKNRLSSFFVAQKFLALSLSTHFPSSLASASALLPRPTPHFSQPHRRSILILAFLNVQERPAVH